MVSGTSSAQEKGGSSMRKKCRMFQLEKFKLKILELLFFKPQVNCGEASSLRALEFGEGCNVLRLHTRDIARGSGKLSNKGIAIDLVPNKGRLF